MLMNKFLGEIRHLKIYYESNIMNPSYFIFHLNIKPKGFRLPYQQKIGMHIFNDRKKHFWIYGGYSSDIKEFSSVVGSSKKIEDYKRVINEIFR